MRNTISVSPVPSNAGTINDLKREYNLSKVKPRQREHTQQWRLHILLSCHAPTYRRNEVTKFATCMCVEQTSLISTDRELPTVGHGHWFEIAEQSPKSLSHCFKSGFLAPGVHRVLHWYLPNTILTKRTRNQDECSWISLKAASQLNCRDGKKNGKQYHEGKKCWARGASHRSRDSRWRRTTRKCNHAKPLGLKKQNSADKMLQNHVLCHPDAKVNNLSFTKTFKPKLARLKRGSVPHQTWWHKQWN